MKRVDEQLRNRVAHKQLVQGDAQAFAHEARRLARLRHPARPKVSDHFVEDTGHFWVMERREGDDLATVLVRRGRAFVLTELLAWADQLLAVV